MPKKSQEFKNILPSKKFVNLMLLCVGSCVVILVVASYLGSQSSFSKPGVSVEKSTTVQGLLAQDSNNNGIADWEESLYGLDPKGDGPANKKIIDAKKLQVRADNGINQSNDADLDTVNGKLSQQMLSTILALKQSGNLTPTAIQNLGDSLGQNVNSKRDTGPTYTIDNITVVGDSNAEMLAYEKGFQSAIDSASKNGAGNELAAIYQVLDASTGKDSVKNLDTYINGYTKFGTDLIAIKTPQSITQKSLALANACALMAHSLQKIEVMYTDAPTGLVGFDEYATARSAIVDATVGLTTDFGK